METSLNEQAVTPGEDHVCLPWPYHPGAGNF